MPWRCPSCHLPISHSEIEYRPRLNTTYRCHVCRLELVIDPKTDKLVVAPIEDAAPEAKTRDTR